MHYQGTDLGQSFITSFPYGLIHESIMFVKLLAVGMGGRLICETAFVQVHKGSYVCIMGAVLFY